MTSRIRTSGIWLLSAVLLLTSCGRAPSFDILGSFFPAWLVCLALSLLLTGALRWLSLRIPYPACASGFDLAEPRGVVHISNLARVFRPVRRIMGADTHGD